MTERITEPAAELILVVVVLYLFSSFIYFVNQPRPIFQQTIHGQQPHIVPVSYYIVLSINLSYLYIKLYLITNNSEGS